MILKNIIIVLMGISFFSCTCGGEIKNTERNSVLVTIDSEKLEDIKNENKISEVKTTSDEVPRNMDVNEKDKTIIFDTIPPRNNAERDRNTFAKSTFTRKELNLMDSIPFRLLHYNLQRKIKARTHHFGKVKLNMKMGGHYHGKIPNARIGVFEYFPNVLMYGERVEYYDSNQVLMNKYKFNDHIPLESKHKKKLIKRKDFPGEFISETNSYTALPNFLDDAKYILVKTRSEAFITSPIIIVTYHIEGFNDEYKRIGYKCVIKLINENGVMDFQQEFDKRVYGKYIDEDSKFLFLSLNYGVTGNKNSTQGNYFVFDINSGEKLFEYFPNLEKEESYGGPIGEYQSNIVQFGISIEKDAPKEYFDVHGIFDVLNRKFYKVIYNENDHSRFIKEDPRFWRNLPKKDWEFIQNF